MVAETSCARNTGAVIEFDDFPVEISVAIFGALQLSPRLKVMGVVIARTNLYSPSALAGFPFLKP